MEVAFRASGQARRWLRPALSRLASSLLIVIAVVFLCHGMISLAGGRFADTWEVSGWSHAAREARQEPPWYLQSARWVNGAVKGNLGESLTYRQPVAALLAAAIPHSLALAVTAVLAALVFSIPLGILSAVRKGTSIDRLLAAAVFVLLSVPTLFLALLALTVAAVTGWFPIGGAGSGPGKGLGDYALHLFLPASVLAAKLSAIYLRQVRASMLDVLREDYVRTALAKGLPRVRVYFRHAFPNASHALITLVGMSFATVISGALAVEIVMSWPGLGRLTTDAVLSRDMPLAVGGVVVATVALLAGNLMAETLLRAVDPRIQAVPYEGSPQAGTR